MNDKKLVSVIVVNWNGKEHLEGCFTSLKKQTYDSLELLLVDNASVDGSVGYVEGCFPMVNVLVNPENRGFGPAVNRGVEQAKGAYVLFLNNDYILVTSSELENLFEFGFAKRDGFLMPN